VKEGWETIEYTEYIIQAEGEEKFREETEEII
jgi:hypothetical protein